MVDTGGYGKFGELQVVTYNANNTFNGGVVAEVAVHLSAHLRPLSSPVWSLSSDDKDNRLDPTAH